MRKLHYLLLIIMVAALPAFAAKAKTGEDVIKAMHKKYSKNWYKTLTFVQKNTQYRPDGSVQNSLWYEAMSLPGKLRIDFDPLADNMGMMFIDGQFHSINSGKIARSQHRIHPLMLFGFDVYTQPVDKTLKQIEEIKLDLSVLHEEKSDGRTVYVIGAKKGDLKTKQVWIDKKDLIFLKIIEPAGQDGKGVQETQFNKYRKVKSGGWISAEVVFLMNGKRAFVEEYSDIQTNVTLNEDLFDPKGWSAADKTYFKLKN
ncbi:MAG: hypothetical protein KDB79_11980 [Acidobacteria bacterium]|nr:hypothetical protein [Acidobacteriota bacterium]